LQDLYKFVPEKKYTEDLEDTSEFDPEGEDNDDDGFTTDKDNAAYGLTFTFKSRSYQSPITLPKVLRVE
jgi:hypothetical protein